MIGCGNLDADLSLIPCAFQDGFYQQACGRANIVTLAAPEGDLKVHPVADIGKGQFHEFPSLKRCPDNGQGQIAPSLPLRHNGPHLFKATDLPRLRSNV